MNSGLKIQKYSSITVVFVCFLLLTFALPMPLYAAGEIVSCGDNTYGQATPPDGNDYIAVAGGYYHSLALKSDGSIVGWGFSTYGQATPPDGNNYTAIAAGGIHSLALKSDNSIVGWGYNSEGQATPPAGNSYKAIAAGYEHSLALKSDGSIIGWGRNNYGQTTPPDGNNYIAISAGGYHSIALKSDGSIVAWGYNIDGETMSPTGNDYIAIAAGLYHSIALKSDGSMVGWGFNDHDRATPPAGNDYIAIAAGVWHNLALKSDRSIVGWGYNDHGQATPPGGNNFIAIAAGGYHSLALKKNTYGGSGTLTNPYKIATKADLLALAANTGDYSKYFILTADINLLGETFTQAVIAPDTDDTTSEFEGTQFTGVFDGNDHVISNLLINASTENYAGLFGYVGSGGQVKNLGVEDVNVTGKNYIGGLLGYNEGGTLTACYATGSVNGSSYSYIGGLLGYNYGGTLTSCHASGSVNGSWNTGGLLGYNDGGTLTACYSSGSVNSSYCGGLLGYNWNGTVTSSYATGAVSGYTMVGGLAGYSHGSITSCYATGLVSGTDHYIGGLVGYDNYGAVTSCYSSGSVSGAADTGGLLGYNFNGTLTDCFWDTQTSGQATSAGGTGETTAQMQTLSTFTDAGWDFVGETVNGTADIWKMPLAGGYPILSWQEAMAVPLNFQVTKCTVTAGSKSNSDAISFSGTIDANADDFNDANSSSDANFVKVTIRDVNTEDMDPCVFTFPVNNKTYKKGKFKSAITSKPLKMSFAFDTKKTTFSFSASNVDLTGLSCPVIVTIQIGGSSGSVSLDETIVNGTKKLIPYQLLMGAQNSLMADKVSFKRSSKPDANSLTVSGRFTTTTGPDLSNPMVITVASQTFTVTGDKFLSKNGVVSCKNAVANEGPLVRVTAKLDYVKCTFTISVKYASITQHGVVDFGIDCFGVNLDGLETIDLGL
jgi:hypothetical protein